MAPDREAQRQVHIVMFQLSLLYHPKLTSRSPGRPIGAGHHRAMGLFRPAKVVRQAGRAAPTNFLGYVILFLAMATGMLNRFLASALWPLLVTLLVLGISWQYVAGWLDALREWRRPTPSARRPTATPVTKQELQARLIVAERLDLGS